MRLTLRVLGVVMLLAFAGFAGFAGAAQRAPAELPAATGGPAAGRRDPKLQLVATIPANPPAGIALSRGGRIFISFPRWGDASWFSLAELSAKDGSLAPFPSAEAHQPGHGEDHLVSVQGIDLDADDRLWILDAGRARLYCYDLESRQPLQRITFPAEVLKPGAYLNDVRVDVRRGEEGRPGGFAYISDSARGGILVVDLATGKSWRRLESHPSSRPEKDFVAVVEGQALSHRPAGGKPTPMRGNTDGIALSPDGKTVYFNAFSSRTLYAIPAEALCDPDLSEEAVGAQVKRIAAKPSANDGMNTDPQGRLYTTDYESNAIRRVDPSGPATPAFEMLVQDERLLWPDAVWAHDGYLYITTNQLNRMPGLHEGRDRRVRPYAVFRYPL